MGVLTLVVGCALLGLAGALLGRHLGNARVDMHEYSALRKAALLRARAQRRISADTPPDDDRPWCRRCRYYLDDSDTEGEPGVSFLS